MKMKNFLSVKTLAIIVLIIAVFVVGKNEGLEQSSKINEQYKSEIEKQTLENNSIPECNFGKCPESQSMDVDGDGESETVTVIYTSMTQFAGKVMVIKNGKVIFTSDEKMRIAIDQRKDTESNGFVIFYSTEPNSNNATKSDYYKFDNGKFVLEKTE